MYFETASKPCYYRNIRDYPVERFHFTCFPYWEKINLNSIILPLQLVSYVHTNMHAYIYTDAYIYTHIQLIVSVLFISCNIIYGYFIYFCIINYQRRVSAYLWNYLMDNSIFLKIQFDSLLSWFSKDSHKCVQFTVTCNYHIEIHTFYVCNNYYYSNMQLVIWNYSASLLHYHSSNAISNNLKVREKFHTKLFLYIVMIMILIYAPL